MQAVTTLVAELAVSFAAFIAAGSVWGDTGFVVAAVLAPALLALMTLATKYKLDNGR